jgi:hypothetical protein
MENEPQIEERYRRLYRTFETTDGKKSYDLFIRQDKDKTTISTIQSEKTTEGEEHTLSVFLREEKKEVNIEVWSGSVGEGIKHYERKFTTKIEYDAGMLFMSEIYDNALRSYNRTDTIALISDKLVDFAKIQMKKKQKNL